MAITLTKVTSAPYPTGDRFRTIYKLAADNSYVTGGYSLKPSDLGFANAANSDPEFSVEVDNSLGYGTRYDYANLKLLFYSAAGTQVAGATDLSALTDVRVRATSKYTA